MSCQEHLLETLSRLDQSLGEDLLPAHHDCQTDACRLVDRVADKIKAHLEQERRRREQLIEQIRKVGGPNSPRACNWSDQESEGSPIVYHHDCSIASASPTHHSHWHSTNCAETWEHVGEERRQGAGPTMARSFTYYPSNAPKRDCHLQGESKIDDPLYYWRHYVR
jgi:hypothetical protein